MRRNFFSGRWGSSDCESTKPNPIKDALEGVTPAPNPPPPLLGGATVQLPELVMV